MSTGGTSSQPHYISRLKSYWIFLSDFIKDNSLKLEIWLMPLLRPNIAGDICTFPNSNRQPGTVTELIVFRCYLSVQFSSVAQSCLTLCDPMNRSTPGLPIHHQLLEFTQTHVHRVSDAIQPSHPLSSPSPPAPNPSQHQSLFQ